MARCCWAGEDPLMIAYHDTEWGVPSHDDRHLYEMLILEGAQAGLSWQTDARDNRLTNVSLSDAGLAVVLECMPRRIAFINATLDGLPDDLVHALSEALLQIETRLAEVPALAAAASTASDSKSADQPADR